MTNNSEKKLSSKFDIDYEPNSIEEEIPLSDNVIMHTYKKLDSDCEQLLVKLKKVKSKKVLKLEEVK